MYYGLRKTARLRRERECVVLLSTDEKGNLRYLHPLIAVLLALCNGQRSGEELMRVLTEAFRLPAESARELVGRLGCELAPFVTASPEPLAAANRYDPLDFVYQPSGDPHLRRLTAPVFVAWLVTERCPFDCVYCCIQTRPAAAPPDGEMTGEQAFRFLDDCIASGVQVVTFHGGEPFLRKDTPEMIGYLISRGVAVSISSKLALSEEIARRLAGAGLDEMQVSIDTDDHDAADRMVGHHNYLRGALANIELLRRHGIAATINTVVTGRNVRDIPRLIRFLAARGVKEIALSGYLRSFRKHNDELLAGADALRKMAAEVDALRPELPGVEIGMCSLHDPREVSLARAEGFSACSGGRSGLVVGADGRVSLCDRLLPFEETTVGNVTEESLLDIWNGQRLRAFLDPGDEAFAGTECAGCGLKSDCDWRVRCYYRSQMIEQRVFAPDHLCPVVPAPSIRFF
ncbi:MAG TPA: radical SAM protein [Thermoanaerobaculia bacterium]|nr:radical SAM protein [Thermoanaerobaculia bacterium]